MIKKAKEFKAKLKRDEAEREEKARIEKKERAKREEEAKRKELIKLFTDVKSGIRRRKSINLKNSKEGISMDIRQIADMTIDTLKESNQFLKEFSRHFERIQLTILKEFSRQF